MDLQRSSNVKFHVLGLRHYQNLVEFYPAQYELVEGSRATVCVI